MLREVPLLDGYTLSKTELIFPMNITEVWDNFFENDAPFAIDIALGDLGEIYSSQGEWKTPSKESKKKTPADETYLKHRVVVS